MSTHRRKDKVFRIDIPYTDPVRRRIGLAVARMIEWVMGLHRLQRFYDGVASGPDVRPYADRLLEALGVSYKVSDEDVARIPKEGAVMVVANHPFGGIEGVMLASLLRSVRPDVKIMANYHLGVIPELRDLFILVDPFDRKGSARMNLRGLKESLQWLGAGGMLAAFPSGEVSHVTWRNLHVTEPPWSDTVARLVLRTRAAVLPVFFEGCNGPLFQALGLVHPLLRTLRLPREFLRMRGRTLPVRIGNPVPFERLARFDSTEDVTTYLRLRTHILTNRDAPERRRPRFRPQPRGKTACVAVAPAEDARVLAEEIARLPKEHLLCASRAMEVYEARAPEIPHVLREIGRLRELTFREVGEGTGKELDLDPFDDYYLHLFVWNRQKRELVGAYRLGEADEILKRLGPRGLYTSTLFKYKRRLLRQLGPALELGRAFVRAEYQKNFSPLMLLWKGIGQIVLRRPRCRMLFGPVSINNEYSSVSRDLIVAFLTMNEYLPELAKMVRAKHPLRRRRIPACDLKATSTVVVSVDDVSTLVSEIEADHKGIPILLRQYLKLGGKLLGFNVDPDFCDVVDGLLLVDLTKADRRTLDRYMGEANTGAFLARHAGAREAVVHLA